MKILIIDDDEAVLNQFKDAIELWNGKSPTAVFDAPDFVQDLAGARNKIESSALFQYDGVVIDLRFKDTVEGDKLLELINQRSLRVPVVVYTGTPDSVKGFCFKVFTKGEVNADGILTWFFDVKISGLMAVMGMQGVIEQKLKVIFDSFQEYGLKKWAKLGKSKGMLAAERSASRYVLMNLLDALEYDDDKVFPYEMYLQVDKECPLKTGDIVRKTGTDMNGYYMVMSPACDLVVRDCGLSNSGSVMLVKLATIAESAQDKINQKIAEKKKKSTGVELTEEQIREIIDGTVSDFNFGCGTKEPKKCEYLHPMPPVDERECRYVSFRDVLTIPYAEMTSAYEKTGMRVSPPFLKNIQARFASYYGRQGQPDVAFSQVFMDVE